MPNHYEWDVETVIDNEVEEHDHIDNLTVEDLKKVDDTHELVLVRDSYGDKSVGDDGRSWAYVDDWVLPEYFEDACGNETAKVPKKYRVEFEKCLKKYMVERL